MPEFRQNLATKEWIIFAAERGKRPEEFARERPMSMELPAYSATCPFCPGQEGSTPPPVLTLPVACDTADWSVRVVPNKFPALVPHPGEPCQPCSAWHGPYLTREGVGAHEVIIETPVHNRDLPTFTAPEMEAVLQAYRQRYNAMLDDPGVEMVLIFRNHGARAGTSLIHPHSQIVGSSVVPFHIRNKLYEGQRYFDMFGRCVYCDILAYEMRVGERMVMDNDYFVAFVPYAASVPYEIWLIPKQHAATFGMVRDRELSDCAHALQDMLARLYRLLSDPDYNYIIDTAPEHLAEVPFYHWHLEIYPRLTTRAGFEIGSGMGINIVLPEQAATALRGTDGARILMDGAPASE